MYNESSFSINLVPVTDGKNSWTGELEVVIMTDKENPLDSESCNSLMHLSDSVASDAALARQLRRKYV